MDQCGYTARLGTGDNGNGMSESQGANANGGSHAYITAHRCKCFGFDVHGRHCRRCRVTLWYFGSPKSIHSRWGEPIILAKRGRSGTGLRGRDRDRPDDNPTGDDGTPDQGQGNDDDGPDAPDTPGDDDGTPDQGSGDR